MLTFHHIVTASSPYDKLAGISGLLIAAGPAHGSDRIDGLVLQEDGRLALVTDLLRGYKDGFFQNFDRKPIEAFVDADEVLFDFYTYFNPLVSQAYDINLDLRQRPSRLDYGDVLKHQCDDARVLLNTLPATWPMELTPFAYSKLYLQALRNLGVKINVISAVKTEWMPARIKALRTHGMAFDSAIGTGDAGKEAFVTALLPPHSEIYAIDDMVKNAVAMKKNFPNGKGYTIHAPYNDKYIEKHPDAVKQVSVSHDINQAWMNLIADVCRSVLSSK